MIKYNDAYIEHIVRAHLQPGEQLMSRTAGVHRPLWTLGIRFFWRNYLLLATNQRLILVEHRRGLIYDRLEKVESIPWNAFTKAKVSGLMSKKLKLTFGARSLKLRVPALFAPMSRNVQGAKGIVSTWQQGMALAAPQQQALQAGYPQSGYPQPQQPQRYVA